MTSARPSLVRQSLVLTASDQEDLNRLRESSAHRSALARLVGDEAGATSEAAVLLSVIRVGLRAVQEQVEVDGYALMAAEIDGPARQTSARRRLHA